jgi:anti-sigma factor RsiW
MARYVDGTLPEAERSDVERHLEACPPCRRAAEAEEAGRRMLRHCAARLRQETLPPGLRTRCEAIAHEQCAARRALWQGRLLPVAFGTLGLLFAGVAALAVLTPRSNRVLAAQLTADHMRCFRDVPPEAAAVDATAVEGMLRTRYGWDLHVPPSSDANALRLVGARRCVYIEGRIPHVMYRVNGEDVSLYVLTGVAAREGEVATLGHRTRIWSRGNTTYALVSRGGGEHVNRAAGYVRQEVH